MSGPAFQTTGRLAEDIIHCLTKYGQDGNGSQSQEYQKESILHEILTGFIAEKFSNVARDSP